MSEWQPIETAPKWIEVRMGRWAKSYIKPEGIEWVETIGKAKFKTILPWDLYTREGNRNTHWQPLPEPPRE